MPFTPPPAAARGFRRRPAALLAGLAGIAWTAWVGAAPLAAQSASDPATASAEASLALTSLDGAATWMASAAALLGVTSRLSLGGAGTVALGTRVLPGSTPGTDLALRTAFGGLVGQVELACRDDRALWLRVLAGAGNAKMDLALAGTQIASDNFGVIVPEIGASLRLADPLSVGAALGYRATFGVEDLPGLAPSDLRGVSVRLLIAVHRF